MKLFVGQKLQRHKDGFILTVIGFVGTYVELQHINGVRFKSARFAVVREHKEVVSV